MGSWAQIASQCAQEQPAKVADGTKLSRSTTAVVDTNAIISGLQPHCLAERVLSLADVLEEVRDVKSREFLARLPFGIELAEPAAASLSAVTRFARATGDLQSLSDTDLRILALTHTLEVEANGSSHLRELPAQQAVKRTATHSTQDLPGWGDAGSTWAQLDKLNAEEEARQGAASAANGLQSLSLEPACNAESPASSAQGDCPEGGAQDNDWERAAKSRGAARQKRRKERRREMHLAPTAAAQMETPADDSSQPEGICRSLPQVASVQQQRIAQGHAGLLASPGALQDHAAEQPASTDKSTPLVSIATSAEGTGDSQRLACPPAPCFTANLQAHSMQQGNGASPDNGSLSGDDGGASETSSDSQSYSEDAAAEGLSEPDASSNAENDADAGRLRVTCVTADFAMQNVLLQMGLQLQAPNGLRLKRVSRFVQRCSACYFVVRGASKVFCPRCGNAALQKVSVTVNSNGEEVIGVRKQHVLRGTRFALPKPRGGKQSKDLILSEDMMVMRRQRKPSKPGDEDVDPLEKLTTRAAAPLISPAISARLPFGQRNPNERSHARTNRRKK